MDLIKKAIPFIKFFMRQELWLISKGRFRQAYNYFWAIAFTEEEGMAILDPLYSRYQWLAPYPGRIELEITNRCSLRCAKCEHTYWKEPPRDLSLEDFKNIIDQFPKLKWIGLTGIGESFLHKDFFKMLEYVKSRDVIVELYDTFYFIDKEKGKKLIHVGLDRLLPSIDASTKAAYEKIRVGSNFDLVINNIKEHFNI